MWIVLPTIPRPDAPVAGPGAHTFESDPNWPAAIAVLLDDGFAEALLLPPPLGVLEPDRPQDVATKANVTAAVTRPSSFGREDRELAKRLSTQ